MYATVGLRRAASLVSTLVRGGMTTPHAVALVSRTYLIDSNELTIYVTAVVHTAGSK